MVDDAGTPVLIDIEGTMVFDVEWEHAFLELRFGPLYPLLRTVPLDEARMRLYRLVQHLSLVAGPLLLIDPEATTYVPAGWAAAGRADGSIELTTLD